MKILIIARLGSKRLPKKHFKKLVNSKLVIDHLLENVLKSFKYNELVLCTTTSEIDNELANYVYNKYDIEIFRGDEHNVLKRIYDCIKVHKCDYFIRLNGDNILTDGALLKALSIIHELTKSEFTTNVSPRSLSKGLSFQACNSNLFFNYYQKIKNNIHCKEHVFFEMDKHTKRFLNISINSDFLKKDDFALDTINDLDKINDYIKNNKSIYWNE